MKFTDSTVAVGSVLVRALAPLLLALALGGCSNQATPHADSVEAGASREPAAVSEADPGAETTGQPPAGDPAPGGTILDADSAAATPAGEGAGKAPAGEANAGAPAAVPTSTSAGGSSTRKPEVVVPRGAEEAVKVFPMVKGEWRMWGGNPGRNMANPFEKRLPAQWNVETGENIKWRVGLGSQSYGNPVVADGRILVGTNNDRERNPKITGDKGVIMCFRESDGKFLWQMVHDKLTSGKVNDWPDQGICSGPVVEDGKFYYVSNQCQVVCADLDGLADGNDGPYTEEKYSSAIDGDFIWVFDMMDELGVFPHNLATSSPLVVGDLVYVVTSNGVERDHQTIPSPRAPSFIAVDKRSGELVWESTEPGENILHGQWSCASYGVAGNRPQVVFPGGDGWLYSFQPRSGKLIWKFDCNPKDSVWDIGGLGTRNNLVSTPVFFSDSVYISVGQDPEHGNGVGHLYRIRGDGLGDVTEKKQVWHLGGGEEFDRSVSTVAIHDGLVYACDLTGYLHCIDQKTGAPLWVHDMLAAVWGSPAVIDDKVYLGDQDGDLVVFRAGRKKEVLATMDMESSVYSTAVAANGVLYISTRENLFALAEGANSGPPKN